MEIVKDENQTPLTKEELKTRREELNTFYKENIEYLRVQKEYETLLKDVEQARYEKMMYQGMIIELMYSKEPQAKQEFKAGQDEDAEGRG